MPYETDADIPHRRFNDVLMRNLKNPFKASGDIAGPGGEGNAGRIRTLLLQALGGSAGAMPGGLVGAEGLRNGKPVMGVAGLLAGLLGGGLGIAGGGALAQGAHNADSRGQFGKALKGSLSEEDRLKVPTGLLKLMDKGHADKVMQMLPQTAPDIAKRPYVQQLFGSQRERI